MNKKFFRYLLFTLLLIDIGYSFVQHMNIPLDGDMADGILPGPDLEPIFSDPLGISVITDQAVYPNPNRYFAHLTFLEYFTIAPAIFQNIYSPIESVYISCALAKTIIQVGLIFLLAFYSTSQRRILSDEFLLGAVIITPFFQTNGYRNYLGIIDQSTTYTFFYALPCAILLLIYLPIFRNSFYGSPVSKNKLFLFILFASTLFISLNGPLIPGIVLVISLVLFLLYWSDKKRGGGSNVFQRIFSICKSMPTAHFVFFVLISSFSLYSLYVGSGNVLLVNDSLPIGERFSRLPMGIYNLVTQKLGFPLLLAMILLNNLLIRQSNIEVEKEKILRLFNLVGLFAIFYILLLPFGGYKFYRPNIIRYDTIMPVTIALIGLYGISSLFLIRTLKASKRNLYGFVVAIVALIFTFSDKPEFGKNECEINGLMEIAQSKDSIVEVKSDCNIMSWVKITDPNMSELNAGLLKKLKITEVKKLYYQK